MNLERPSLVSSSHIISYSSYGAEMAENFIIGFQRNLKPGLRTFLITSLT